jgi:hypothetical protein
MQVSLNKSAYQNFVWTHRRISRNPRLVNISSDSELVSHKYKISAKTQQCFLGYTFTEVYINNCNVCHLYYIYSPTNVDIFLATVVLITFLDRPISKHLPKIKLKIHNVRYGIDERREFWNRISKIILICERY